MTDISVALQAPKTLYMLAGKKRQNATLFFRVGRFCRTIAVPSFDVTINSSAPLPVGTNEVMFSIP